MHCSPARRRGPRRRRSVFESRDAIPIGRRHVSLGCELNANQEHPHGRNSEEEEPIPQPVCRRSSSRSDARRRAFHRVSTSEGPPHTDVRLMSARRRCTAASASSSRRRFHESAPNLGLMKAMRGRAQTRVNDQRNIAAAHDPEVAHVTGGVLGVARHEEVIGLFARDIGYEPDQSSLHPAP